MLNGVLKCFALALDAILHLASQLLIHAEVLYLQLTIPLLLCVDEFGRHTVLKRILAVVIRVWYRLVQELVLLRLLIEQRVLTFLAVWQMSCLGDLVVRLSHSWLWHLEVSGPVCRRFIIMVSTMHSSLVLHKTDRPHGARLLLGRALIDVWSHVFSTSLSWNSTRVLDVDKLVLKQAGVRRLRVDGFHRDTLLLSELFHTIPHTLLCRVRDACQS